MRKRTSPAMPVPSTYMLGVEAELDAEVDWIDEEERLCKWPIRGNCNADESVARYPTIVALRVFTSTLDQRAAWEIQWEITYIMS